MSKKNWIFIKRGLSEDPKHRARMGMSVWLFMHICDAADWETGKVYDWKDKEVGIDMTASTATIRDWRQRLAELGYITCTQKQHSLEIVIHNWNNPREYNGKKMNIRQGDNLVSPCEENKVEGTPQGDTQGDTQGVDGTIVNPPSFIESSSSSSSRPLTTTSEQIGKIFTIYEQEIGAITPLVAQKIGGYIDDPKCPSEWIVDAIQEASRQNKRNWAYCEAILNRWKVEGKQARVKLPSGSKYPKPAKTFLEQLAEA
jgi:DnaD/phage-associated family protein